MRREGGEVDIHSGGDIPNPGLLVHLPACSYWAFIRVIPSEEPLAQQKEAPHSPHP